MSWGLGPWGFSPWGGGDADELALLSATAVRENLVRLAFSLPVRLRGDLAPRDAGHLRKYSIVANASTVGLDGLPARAVLPALAELALVEGAGGALVDLWLDRPLSPYGALYSVAVTEIYGEGGELLEPGSGLAAFDGMRAAVVPAVVDRVVVGSDFANPQSPALLADDRVQVVGSFVPDATGDYATDQGLVSYRKRVMRRLFTRKGRFAHLPRYGVDVPALVKHLARPSDRARFAADAEEQVKQEPETAAAQVRLVQLAAGAWELQVRARTRFGQVVEMAERLVVGGA